MAFIFHDGFETGGADLWSSVTGTPSFAAGYANTGNYGMRCNASATNIYVQQTGSSTKRISFYLYIASGSSGLCVIAGGSSVINLRLNGTTLYLYDVSTNKGSYAISTGQWYRISVSTDGVGNAKVYVNGTERISSSSMSATYLLGSLGIFLGTADLYYDDYAADDTASTDDIGDIRILAARPVGEGTDQDTATSKANGWADHLDTGVAVYSELDDDPPSTSTFNCADNNNTDRYSVTLDECGSGNLTDIGPTDEIMAVNFAWYYETEAGGADDYGHRIICSDGTFTDDNINDPKDPTWLAKYCATTPQGLNAWTQAYVNSLEMGMSTITSGSKGIWWYEAYAMVAYKVVSAGAVNVNVNEGTTTVSDACEVYITPYLINQADENPEVTDSSTQYLNPYPLVNMVDENPSVEDYANVSVVSANVNIDIADENPEVTDETAQYITPYPLISVYDDLEISDETSQYLTVYEISVADDLSLSDETQQYLTIYEISVYDDLTLEDITSQYLSLYEISQYDSLEIQEDATVKSDVQILVYDDITLEDISEQYLSLYEIYISDDLDVQDATEQFLTIYEISVYDSLDVEDYASQYLTIYEIYVADDLSLQDETSIFLTIYEIYAYDELTVEDYGETALTGEGILSVNEYDSVTVTDESLQYLTKYLISVFNDLTVEDVSNQYLSLYEIYVSDDVSIQEDITVTLTGAGIISINQYDDLSLTDESEQYLTLYVIYVSNDLTVEDITSQYLSLYEISVFDDLSIEESTSLELSYYEISVNDNLTVQDETDTFVTAAGELYVYEYDGLIIQDSQETQLTPYLITASDNLTVEDSDVTNLNFYIVYQSEDISLEDYANITEVGIGTRNIEAYDELSLTDYVEKYLSLYEINENDSIEIQDSTSSALDLYLISESDSLAVSDSPTARLTPYLISEYEPVTVQEYSNQIVALKTREAIGSDTVELSDYADVSFVVYPFLYAILRAKNTESVFEVNKTRTELDVTN